MTIKLLDLYKSLLSTASLKVTEDGFVKVGLGKTNKPMTVKGKSLVLPTDDQLKNPDWSKRAVFHPLYENIMHGESDVLAAFRQAVNLKINFVLGTLAHDHLMTLATSPAEHSRLNPDQSEFLSKVKNADEKTLHVLEKLLDAAPASQSQKSLVHLYLKKTGTVQGKRYSRVAVVTFPLYQELKKEAKDHTYFGVKMRVKDRDALLALMEYIFPGIDEPEAYNRGSNSEVAPSMDALMHSVAALAGSLNAIVELFSSVIDDETVEQLRFEDSWVEPMDNLGALVPQIRGIPMLPGNEGASKATEVAATPAPTPVAAPTPAPQFAHAPPMAAPAPTPVAHPQQSWQPPVPQMQQPYPVMQPMPGMQMGYPYGQNPMQPMQQPNVKTADGKLNFDALVATSPQVMGAVQQGMQQFGVMPMAAGYQQQQQPRERVPGWAAVAQPQGMPGYGHQPAMPHQGFPMMQQQGYMPGRI